MNAGYYTEDEIIHKAEDLAEIILGDIKYEYSLLMRGYDMSKTHLVTEEIEAREKKWLNSCGELEDLLSFLMINERYKRALVKVNQLLERIKKRITSNIQMMKVHLLIKPIMNAVRPLVGDEEGGTNSITTEERP